MLGLGSFPFMKSKTISDDELRQANYKKLGPALISAIFKKHGDENIELTIFIRTHDELDNNEADLLESLGVNQVRQRNSIFTATLSIDSIIQLSQLPWIQFLDLSGSVRLASGN